MVLDGETTSVLLWVRVPRPHREGGHVTVMLRGVLIGWFDPGWQVFHLS